MLSATIIIPTLNEAGNIDALIERINSISIDFSSLQLLFVDDQSSDNTVAKIQTWQQSQDNIKVLQRKGEPDLAQSVIDGVAQSDTDCVVVMDADLSHPVEKIIDLLKPIYLGTHDIVVGSRYVKNGGINDWPLHRRFLSWFGGLPARILTNVKDTTSGFFACRKDCFDNLDREAKGYKILIEILASGLDQYRVKEVPILFTDRTHGQSKLSSKQLIQYVQRLIALSGASVSSTTARRFISVGFLGVFIDALVFYFLINSGWQVSNAHITSFFVAATSNYFFNSIWSFEYRHYTFQSWYSKAIKYVFFALIALTIRGGVLAISIHQLGISPSLAIYPAIFMAAIVNYFGVSLIVFPKKESISVTQLSIHWRVVAAATVSFMILLRFLYLGTTELIPDEAYYWNYKEHIDIGYLDHPPLLAWMILLFTNLLGDNEFSVRIFSLLCGAGTIFFLYRATALIFDRTSAYIAAFLASVLPFTVLPGFLATTDAPTMLFWSACLYFLAKVIQNPSKFSWIALGTCLGFGMLSKYSFALLVISIVILFTFDRSLRSWWTRPLPYLSAMITVVLFAPVVIWNLQHEWSSFAFQTTRRLDRAVEFSTHYLLFHLLILLTPVGIYLFVKAFVNVRQLVTEKYLLPDLAHSYILYFLIVTLLPVSVYILFSFRHYPRFHWTAPIWLAAIPLAAYALSPCSSLLRSVKDRFTKWTIYSSGILCLLYGMLLHFTALGLPLNAPAIVSEHYFWQRVAERVAVLEQDQIELTGKKPLIVGLSKWSVASVLRFYDEDGYVENIVSRNAIGRPAAMFDFWTSPGNWSGHPVIYIAINPNDLASAEVELYTTDLRPPESNKLFINNKYLRTIHYRIGTYFPPR